MQSAVLRLDELRASDRAIAGGKAAHLGELAAHGFPVPAGFVVGVDACRAFFEAAGVPEAVDGLDGVTGAELARRCSELRRSIVLAEMPAALADAVLATHRELVDGRDGVLCAVRSSATAEDQAGASFAGQHGTYYYVGSDTLLEMVRHCWASLWTPEAVAYRSAHGVPHATVLMGVVVQEMVASEVAGVAFTANPVSGDRGEIVVESSWGMGAAIVDGRVTPDRYVLARERFFLRERRIAEKRFMVPSTLGHAERVIPVPHELRRRETLSPELLRTVAEWAIKCQDHFGAPQDVEWAIADGRFHLLQSRPITTLERLERSRDPEGAFVLFKAVAENSTEPLTPLTADLFLSVAPPGLQIIRGRPYLGLGHIRPVVPFDISDEDLAAALYLNPGEERPPLRLSLRRLPLAALIGGFGALASAVALARTRGMPDDFMEVYRGLCRRVLEDARLGPAEALTRLFARVDPRAPIGEYAILVNLLSFRFLPWMTALRAMLRRWVPGLGPEAATLLSSGTTGVLSAEMGRSLLALALEARREPRTRALLLQDPPGAALERLRAEPAASAFLSRLDAFLAVHGHRALKEFDLQSARWSEDRAPVIGMIRNYLAFGAEPTRSEDHAARKREEVEQALRGALRGRPFGGLRGRLIRLAAERTRYYLKLRENSRFYHIMTFGVARKKILAIEAELLRAGRLRCKDDVFFLRAAELEALRSGRLGWPDVEGLVHQRRLEHARFARLMPPRTIGIATRRDAPQDAATDAAALRGQGASPGRYQGVARVILDPSIDLALRPGEVLVAPYTDPAWTPLFVSAGAAVVEVGSYLSHAGTVAREFGMPCVVDVPDCTRRIRTGDSLDVDGDRGLVRILDAGGAGS